MDDTIRVPAHARLAARLFNTPLLIEPGKAAVLAGVFQSFQPGGTPMMPRGFDGTPEPQLAVGGSRTKPGYVLTGDDIAVIQVVGSLVQRQALMDAESGLESYSNLSRMLNAALADDDVRAILLEIDSPGGEAAGLFDFAARVRAATKEKPIVAHANETAFSAAYAIASSASELYLPRTGQVGSIGVITLHVDESARDERLGYKFTPIIAGDRKADFSSHAPLSDRGRAAAQAVVDDLYDVFVRQVASARNISEQSVRGTQAGILLAGDAVKARLADGVRTLEQAYDRTRELADFKGPAKRRLTAEERRVAGRRAALAEYSGCNPRLAEEMARSHMPIALELRDLKQHAFSVKWRPR
jgi:signal peptide peptidase SppA